MYLGRRAWSSGRREKVTWRNWAGRGMHCTESGCGDALVDDEKGAIEFARAYFAYMPQRSGEKPASIKPRSRVLARNPSPT